MKKKIFLTGSQGYIGSRFLRLYGDVFTVTSPRINISSQEEVQRSLSQTESAIVIHLAAKTHIDACENDRSLGRAGEAWKVNVEGTQHIVDACKRNRSYLILFSTECVFDGEKGMYQETNTPHPKNWYGETKYRAEQVVLESGIPACILRSVFTYGHPDHQQDAVKVLLHKMKNKEKIRCVTDQVMSFTYVDDVLKVVRRLIENKPSGILHYAGKKAISMYEFSCKVAAAYGYPCDGIQAVTLGEYFSDRATLRLRRATLNSNKITKLLQVDVSDVDAVFAGMRYNQ